MFGANPQVSPAWRNNLAKFLTSLVTLPKFLRNDHAVLDKIPNSGHLEFLSQGQFAFVPSSDRDSILSRIPLRKWNGFLNLKFCFQCKTPREIQTAVLSAGLHDDALLPHVGTQSQSRQQKTRQDIGQQPWRRGWRRARNQLVSTNQQSQSRQRTFWRRRRLRTFPKRLKNVIRLQKMFISSAALGSDQTFRNCL